MVLSRQRATRDLVFTQPSIMFLSKLSLSRGQQDGTGGTKREQNMNSRKTIKYDCFWCLTFKCRLASEASHQSEALMSWFDLQSNNAKENSKFENNMFFNYSIILRKSSGTNNWWVEELQSTVLTLKWLQTMSSYLTYTDEWEHVQHTSSMLVYGDIESTL